MPKSFPVRQLRHVDTAAIADLVQHWGLELCPVPAASPIPGSYWGEPEAGLIDARLHARPDTPVHSILHEACHFICMDPRRRAGLNTDAGGDYDEENAVCYLQILLADRIEGFGRQRCMADMDAWGYSFRLGSARAWFDRDAADAADWLARHGLVDARGEVTGAVRQG